MSPIPDSEEITWKFALQEDIDNGVFNYYNPKPDKVKDQPTMRNRKQWEINYYVHIIKKFDLCKKGKKGIKKKENKLKIKLKRLRIYFVII